jgi:hypothetical protein
MHATLIERALPFRDNNRRDAVADQIGESTRLGHKGIHPEQQRQACNWQSMHRGEGRRECHESAASKASGVPLPSLHSSLFMPTPEPTIRTGVIAMTSVVIDLMKK